jgi:hypothetical protein
MPRSCHACGASLEGRRPQARFCDATCRSAGHKAKALRGTPLTLLTNETRLLPAERLAPAVESALTQMTWLTGTDDALARLALEYATLLDDSRESDAYAERLVKVGPQLLTTLKALGGTPAERKALGVEREVKGKLAQLRQARAGTAG